MRKPPKPAVTVAHPKLVPLLEKYGVTQSEFVRRGRHRAGGRRDAIMVARAGIITELHSAGTSWKDMRDITGLGQCAIQKHTRAMHNPASHQNRLDNVARNAKAKLGKKNPRVSIRNKELWASGVLHPVFGRVRTPEDIAKQKLSFTPEVLAQMSERQRNFWKDPEFRAKTLAAMNAPEHRALLSKQKTLWMKQHPDHNSRGKGQWLDTPKGVEPRGYVRSSYEVAAIDRLEENPEVVHYEYEKVLYLSTITLEKWVGKWVLPDFLVTYSDGRVVLVEVKPSYVLKPRPENGEAIERLKVAEMEALAQGWGFSIWTETELGEWLLRRKKKKSKQPLKEELCESVLSLLTGP